MSQSRPKQELRLLDSRLDILFWLKLKEELRTPSPDNDCYLPALYLDGSIPAGLQWLGDHMRMELHDDLQFSHLAKGLNRLCSEQIQASQCGKQIPLNALIADLQPHPEEAEAFDRLIGAVTEYPSFGLFVADVAGSYILPEHSIEPFSMMPGLTSKIHFEIIHHQQEFGTVIKRNDIGDFWETMKWSDREYLRGGASTLQGAFDVVLQLFEESRRLLLCGESAEFNSIGCTIKSAGTAIVYARFPQAVRNPITRQMEWVTKGSERRILWEMRGQGALPYLGGQGLMAWVQEQYQSKGLDLDVQANLENDLGL
ncbi:hypothetical protein RBE51_21285 [Pseudomonas taiwanensis]|uniref:hypothetical protein n=1 Tax=Pseudomonas taiwanensis TaxID=470150 RepID=UPI0028DFE15A|nr:hypothetical protein [Pseudomonas taiwanensis]MDT8925332.1 hypothetical protein [Pseudomonas taiwanensis]